MKHSFPVRESWQLRCKRLIYRIEWQWLTAKRKWASHLRHKRSARSRISVQMEFPQWFSAPRER